MRQRCGAAVALEGAVPAGHADADRRLDFPPQQVPSRSGGIMSTTESTATIPALKLFADTQPGSPVSVGTVNFRVNPPQAAGLSILRNDGTFVNDHEILGNSQVISVGFDLGSGSLPRSLSVRLV